MMWGFGAFDVLKAEGSNPVPKTSQKLNVIANSLRSLHHIFCTKTLLPLCILVNPLKNLI